METKKTKVLVFENFDISILKDEEKESLGYAIIEILGEINDDSQKHTSITTNQYGDFIVKAEIDNSIIPNQHYNGIILKIKTSYGE